MPHTPAYLRIAADLRQSIVKGDLPPGSKLPTENQLREHYKVSTTAVKQALAILKSEGLEWPEECGIVGVVARFDAIGVTINWCQERVTDRPATPNEIRDLKLSLRGGHVQVIERTYFAGDRPVETADIVLVASRYELVYEMPVD